MASKWVSIKNSLLLILGLVIIGFSSYQFVLGINSADQDLVDGEEFVVISENTPVAREIRSEKKSLPEVNLQQEENTNTGLMDTIDDPKKDENQNLPETEAGQVTFLSQVENTKLIDHETGLIPDRIVIPTIKLNAPVISAGSRTVKVSDQVFDQWVAPNHYAAGWHGNSAYLGEPGNVVINGHHNEYGKVFGNLVNLNPGEMIYVLSGETIVPYIISNKMIVKEKNENLDTRLMNASWIQPTGDERLTLITCWPPESNTHRLIIVAVPYVTSPERVWG
jgi:LPXTG-site transpeptidase (sortase) family protein